MCIQIITELVRRSKVLFIFVLFKLHGIVIAIYISPNKFTLNMNKSIFFIVLLISMASCSSTQSTLKNTDDNAPNLTLSKDNTFVITAYSKDKKYGYDKDYPINIFFNNTNNETINQSRFLNALAGPKGEKITFTKLESCCPFPTKRSEMGAGFLDVYEVTWDGLKKPIVLYVNIYERGLLMVPVGLGLKKN